jgi:hypothetical protein
MTLDERRTQLRERLQEARAAHVTHQHAVAQLGSQIDQLIGALSVLDQLIAEQGDHRQETDLAPPLAASTDGQGGS